MKRTLKQKKQKFPKTDDIINYALDLGLNPEDVETFCRGAFYVINFTKKKTK